MTDVIVVGLGAAGAATLYQLARHGARVIGIDRYSPPHDRGSCHGETRITRLAIGEGLVYGPFVQRSHEIWRELETLTGAELLTQNGCLVVQERGGTEVHGNQDFLGTTVESARRAGVAYEELTAAEVQRRFPQFALRPDDSCCYEPSGGFLRPERCVAVQLQLAQHHGAQIRLDETVLAVEGDAGGVVVRTETETLRAARCVIAAGPWLRRLLPPDVASLFSVYRQHLEWFPVDPASSLDHSPVVMPVFIWAINGGRVLYGAPQLEHGIPGVKAAGEQFATPGDPEEDPAPSRDAPLDVWESLVHQRIPALGRHPVRVATCWYTVTPDMGFVVDRLPGDERVTLISACSGHGFKHTAALGEAVAEQLCNGSSSLDLSAFRLRPRG